MVSPMCRHDVPQKLVVSDIPPPSKNARGRFERFPPTHLEANMVTGFPITIGEALIIALLLIIIIRR